jgi:hypothetical protein
LDEIYPLVLIDKKSIIPNSAYFNLPVTVDILHNTRSELSKQDEENDPTVIAKFEREVNLLCKNKIVCNAKSQVLIKDKSVYELVVEKGVGIGQIFRYLDRLPSFELHCLGRTEKTFWREYSLWIDGVDCRILEVMPSSMFNPDWLDTPSDVTSWEVDISDFITDDGAQ